MLAKWRKMGFFESALDVCVRTMDAEVEFPTEANVLGKQLFSQIVGTLGIREHWYFGLQYTDSKNNLTWLNLDKKILKQELPEERPVVFHLKIRYYPEDVAEELLQEMTRHLLFLQVKDDILNMSVYCPPEASVLLASFAVQAKYGDYDQEFHKLGFLASEHLLPKRVIEQYQMTPQMWEERITSWYAEHRGLTRDEAELEYLKIAQDLEMYGVSYFLIKNKKGSDLWLGIDALGLNIYEQENKLAPLLLFSWKDIRNVSFHDKRFTIKSTDKKKKDFTFSSTDIKTNKEILQLCMGNHNLYQARRTADTIEIQQMKIQAKEEHMRRQIQRDKLKKEQHLRMEAERQREILEQKLKEYEEQSNLAKNELQRSEEMAELFAEKARVAEEEAALLERKAFEAEEEVRKYREMASKTEDERKDMERKAREAEGIAQQIISESEKRSHEAAKLKSELLRARQAEKLAKQKLIEVATSPQTFLMYDNSPEALLADIDRRVEMSTEKDVQQMSREIEMERMDYLERSKNLKQQLHNLKSEIEGFKVEEKQTQLDFLHNERVKKGENKYSTLRKIQSGTLSSQNMQFFEEL